MGTSADLAVRHNGRTFYQHVSYDGDTSSVLAQLAGTIAAMGADALRRRLEQEPDPVPGNEQDEELHLDRKAMGNAYLAACQARGQEPWNLDYALNYDYGNPDFSHGGAIPLLAPRIEWAHGWVDSIEDASVILDLDRDRLVVPSWDAPKKGQYDAGTLECLWEIDLVQIEGMDPGALAQALEDADLDEEHPPGRRRAAIKAALAQATRGRTAQAADTPWGRNHYTPRGIGASDAFRPSLYFLRGLDDHAAYLQPIVDFLREQGRQTGSALAQEQAVMLAREDGEMEVIVDLREGDLATQNMVDELFEAAAQYSGMIYRRERKGSQRVVSMHSSLGAATGGGPEDKPWDEGRVPDGAEPAGLDGARQAQIEQAIANGDKEQARDQLMYAIVGMDGARWRLIQDSGVVSLDGNEMRQFASHAVSLCQLFERAAPGSTRARLDRLSEGQRSMLLEALDPVDRHILKQLTLDGREAKKGLRP